jgi:NAD+--dinitrogen-reductase ADP-D-ribosyltransferase
MDDHKTNNVPTVPAYARVPFNRCNLPAVILGSLTYQRHPVPLVLDGVAALHHRFFEQLDTIDNAGHRATHFMAHMSAHFSLEHPEEAGFVSGRGGKGRTRADYLRQVRGWSFDANGREGAVLKAWVTSRFGLLPRFHREPLGDYADNAYAAFLEEMCRGLYGTNALEAQLDLLYSYCQYELARRYPGETHLVLYRGVNRVGEHEVLGRERDGGLRVLFNNLNSFTRVRERADEFGDYILTVAVPLAKIFFFTQLLPGRLRGEEEYVAIGGVYEVALTTH